MKSKQWVQTFVLGLGCVLFSISTDAATRKKKAIAIPEVLKKIEAKYSGAATLHARFSQENEMVVINRKQVSSGEIYFKRPGKLRWETEKPEKNSLYSNGKTFWFYTPPFDKDERGQVIERKSSEVQSQLANSLLSGSFSMAKDMTISQAAPNRFVLTPKKGAGGTVERAEITIDLEKELITQVFLEHKGGNKSQIALKDIELGKTYTDEFFTFRVPPNTEIVRE
jgi:outer membrane lipoprotein carrier protein